MVHVQKASPPFLHPARKTASRHCHLGTFGGHTDKTVALSLGSQQTGFDRTLKLVRMVEGVKEMEMDR